MLCCRTANIVVAAGYQRSGLWMALQRQAMSTRVCGYRPLGSQRRSLEHLS